VTCRGDAQTVLVKTREVLSILVERSSSDWPEDAEWRSLLPGWFVAACAEERTAEEERSWLKWWRSLPQDERHRELESRAWSVGDFVHWFLPEQREWWWWGGDRRSDDELLVCIVVEELTVSHGALDWLLRSAGASEVVDENLRDLRNPG
jgi:hypothetical protein